jgi:hypothetical protein
MDFLIIDKITSQNQSLVSQYYNLRHDAYLYFNGVDRYPLSPASKTENSIFVLAIDDDNKVKAGIEVILHRPHSNDLLPFETHIDGQKMADLMPHTNTNDITYAEVKGMAVAPHINDPYLAGRLQRFAFQAFSDNLIEADVMAARLIPCHRNIKILLHCFPEDKLQGRIIENAHPSEDGLPRVTFIAAKPDFPLEIDKNTVSHNPLEYLRKLRLMHASESLSAPVSSQRL